MMRHVRGPSWITSPALAGMKLMPTSGIGIPLGSFAMIGRNELTGSRALSEVVCRPYVVEAAFG